MSGGAQAVPWFSDLRHLREEARDERRGQLCAEGGAFGSAFLNTAGHKTERVLYATLSTSGGVLSKRSLMIRPVPFAAVACVLERACTNSRSREGRRLKRLRCGGMQPSLGAELAPSGGALRCGPGTSSG